MESSEIVNPDRNLNLKINLIVESQDYLGSANTVSVPKLDDAIGNSSIIKWYFTEDKSLLEIKAHKRKHNIQILHTEETKFYENFIYIKGVIAQRKSFFNRRYSEEFILNQLRLNLYWEDIV